MPNPEQFFTQRRETRQEDIYVLFKLFFYGAAREKLRFMTDYVYMG
jgi:hypothetical protein